MSLDWSMIAVVLAHAAVLDVLAAAWIWRRRADAGSVSLVVLLLAAAVWCGGAALELTTSAPAAREFWGSIQYVGCALLPPAWLAFVLQYTNRRNQLSRRLLAFLAVEPLTLWITLVVPATHHLVRDGAPGPAATPPQITFGPMYWVQVVYASALVAVGTGILIARMPNMAGLYRRQGAILLAAATGPTVVHIAATLILPTTRRYEPAAVATSVAALTIVWGAARHRLLDLVPIARNVVFDRLDDPVVVLDGQGRILDRNPAAALVLGPAAAIGSPIRWFLQDTAAVLDATATGAEIRLDLDGRVREFELITSVLPDRRGRQIGQLLHLRDITARKDAERRLRWLADYDQLTRLPNRRLLTDRLAQAIVRARRSRGRCALLVVDLDRFKLINDSLGHQMGDRVLAEVANRLGAGRRDEDSAARLGGDEFALLLPEIATPEDADLVAKRVLVALSEPMRFGGRELIVTGSVGVAVCPDDGNDPHELFGCADAAMYRAKASGRNRSAAGAGPTSTPSGSDRLELGVDLWHALKRSELRLMFQPLVDLTNGTVLGMEALLRWQHPRLGLLPPAAFLGIAEESGLSTEIDRWVLSRACQQAERWARAVRPVRVTVNVSAERFRVSPPTLTADVAVVLRETTLPPELLILEINERTIIEDPEPVASELRQLRDIGVGVALDDFGAGHTSLTHLRQLPIGMLKIDHDLVRGVSDDADDRRILSAVTTLAHILGMTVTAEGVERPDQVTVLQQTGCNAGQGFLFSPPVEADDAEALLTEGDLVPG